jgi:DNA adenine methylase
MRKERSYAEVYNDIWDTVVNVFSILRDPILCCELEMELLLTPFARSEFDVCGDDELIKIKDPVEKARRTILRSFAGFGSAATNAKHSTGFRSNSRKSGSTPARDWANYPENVKIFYDRLKGVVIENRDYKTIINQHDSPETLFYLDPPYVHKTRNMKRGNAAYVHEMTDSHHRDLAEFIKTKQGMFVISGYPSALYAELYNGWALVTKDTFDDGRTPRTEGLWLSPNCQQPA